MATRMDIDERQGIRKDSRTSETPVFPVEGIPEAIGPSSLVKASLGPEHIPLNVLRFTATISTDIVYVINNL